ncbi:MAG: hypothetical protein AAB612_00465 [Patescibacteria group bacterium]
MNQQPDAIPRSIIKLHKKYIKGSEKKALIKEFTVYVCNLTKAVKTGCSIIGVKVYITTKTMKHIYDVKPAVDYDFLILHLPKLIKTPDRVCRNSSSKRGAYLFVKEVNEVIYVISVEECVENGETCLFVATGFRSDEDYLKKFPTIWSWRGGIPSS